MNQKNQNSLKNLKNGSIIKMNFDPVKGNEQKGYRPALVMSNPNDKFPLNGMVAVAPITMTEKGFPTHIRVCAKEIEGAVLLEHLRWVDLKNRDFRFVEMMEAETYQKCLSVQKILLFNEE